MKRWCSSWSGAESHKQRWPRWTRSCLAAPAGEMGLKAGNWASDWGLTQRLVISAPGDSLNASNRCRTPTMYKSCQVAPSISTTSKSARAYPFIPTTNTQTGTSWKILDEHHQSMWYLLDFTCTCTDLHSKMQPLTFISAHLHFVRQLFKNEPRTEQHAIPRPSENILDLSLMPCKHTYSDQCLGAQLRHFRSCLISNQDGKFPCGLSCVYSFPPPSCASEEELGRGSGRVLSQSTMKTNFSYIVLFCDVNYSWWFSRSPCNSVQPRNHKLRCHCMALAQAAAAVLNEATSEFPAVQCWGGKSTIFRWFSDWKPPCESHRLKMIFHSNFSLPRLITRGSSASPALCSKVCQKWYWSKGLWVSKSPSHQFLMTQCWLCARHLRRSKTSPWQSRCAISVHAMIWSESKI